MFAYNSGNGLQNRIEIFMVAPRHPRDGLGATNLGVLGTGPEKSPFFVFFAALTNGKAWAVMGSPGL